MGSENARKYVIVASNSCVFAQNICQINAMRPLTLVILLLFGLDGFYSFGQISNVKETERPNPAVAYDSYIRQADSCYMRRNYELSSDFFSKAFALRKQPVDKHLYNGACAAALAGDSTKAFEPTIRKTGTASRMKSTPTSYWTKEKSSCLWLTVLHIRTGILQ